MKMKRASSHRKSPRDSTTSSSSECEASRSRSSSSSCSSTSSSSNSSPERKKRKKKEQRKLKKIKKKEAKKERKIVKAQKKALKKLQKEERKAEKLLLKQQKKEAREAKRKDKSGPSAVAPSDPSLGADDCGIPLILMNTKARAPETREQYEARQAVLRRVVDPETGRTRLVKGDGEIVEECVSRTRHNEINKQATAGDGAEFQRRTIGWNVD
ncbi:ADP-ribosylation factor-like protein 6-interacting protein 4 [Toxorhynchites rutilus septentrionalis]|uniref:ADP-ribosylation factor-like protein 6-interacting protein 4 n=1 Tax=Toxorhynchites rutilus septentrionalis TaxID=329112 RepID=UPI002479B7EE|nr:ADP-ribosylation factor-like protein 6-interacting protein 4 [Toxorhynchites rutilus septentrionalis]